MRTGYVTEALNRSNGEYCYGNLKRRKNRVIFVYTDMDQKEWIADLNCVGPATVRKIYPDLAAFSADWTITAQLPLN